MIVFLDTSLLIAQLTPLDQWHRRAVKAMLVVYPDASLQDQGWSEFQQWGPSGANAVDCLSFAMMRRHRIRKAFAFDRHFRVAGFETL